MQAPVFMYYRLDNFYQNHRRYATTPKAWVGGVLDSAPWPSFDLHFSAPMPISSLLQLIALANAVPFLLYIFLATPSPRTTLNFAVSLLPPALPSLTAHP